MDSLIYKLDLQLRKAEILTAFSCLQANYTISSCQSVFYKQTMLLNALSLLSYTCMCTHITEVKSVLMNITVLVNNLLNIYCYIVGYVIIIIHLDVC